MAEDFKFELKEHFGVLSESKGGWKVELNSVSWGERDAKFDLRSWSPDHSKMGKGITLTQAELLELKKILNNMDTL